MGTILGLLAFRPELAWSALRCRIPLALSKYCRLGPKRNNVVQVSVRALTVYTPANRSQRKQQSGNSGKYLSQYNRITKHLSPFFFPPLYLNSEIHDSNILKKKKRRRKTFFLRRQLLS